jgi:Chaperone of endosialidase
MKRILLLQLFLFTAFGFAQVGVNTTTPDPSSMLDVSSTNKGALFPRVSLSNINVTTLDGTNPAATGLLIWNTNAATIGGNGVGYYYFNGSIWISVLQAATSDHDWYEIGTTTAPNSIADNMFHTGNVVIGKNTITADNPKLSIEESGAGTLFPLKIVNIKDSSTSTLQHTGINLEMEATSSANEYGISVSHNNPNSPLKYGVYATVENGSGTNSAFQGRVTGTGLNVGNSTIIFDSGSASTSEQRGYTVDLQQPSTAPSKGTQNRFLSNNLALDTGTKYAVYNSFGSLTRNVGGELYGMYNYFEPTLTSTSNKYGSYTSIPSTLGGIHYGIYSEATKANSFAGYFLGRMSIGTTPVNTYILPSSRGTANQIMQTDGVGNVSWVTPASATDSDWFELGTTTTADAITDNIFTQGNVTVGSSTASGGKVSVYNSTLSASLYSENSTSIANSSASGYFLNSGTGSFPRYGTQNVVNGSGTGQKFAVYNEVNANSTDWQTGVFNSMNGSNANFVYGLRNQISATGSGTQTQIGVYSDFSTVSDSSIFGTYNFNISNGNGTHYGIHNRILGSGNGQKYGSYNFITGNGSGVRYGSYNTLGGSGAGTKYGTYNNIDPAAGGVHYGLYSDVLKAGSYAGYFLGNVSIGTSTVNNYILPPSRGTNGQTMQTDATGNVTWVNPVAADADWLEVGGTNSPDAITDNKFTLGDISIGKITAANGKLDVDAATKTVTASFTNTNTSTGSKWGIQNTVTVEPTNTLSYGISNSISGNANFKYGILNSLSGTITGSAIEYGIVNSHLTGGAVDSFGVFNSFNPSALHSGFYYGMYNQVSVPTHTGGFIGVSNIAAHATNNVVYGISNSLSGGGSGPRKAVINTLTGTSTNDVTGIDTEILASGTGDKYGERILISNISGGTHYGVYSEVTKANSYAGYFLGNVSVGTTTANNYILPASRGTIGQTMQTDAAGNVSWVNPPTDTDDQGTDVFSLTGNTLNLSLQNDGVATQTVDLSSLKDHDWYEVGTTNSPDDINDNIFKQGSVTIGSTIGATAVLDIDNSTRARSLDINNTFTTNPIGINIAMNSTASGKNGISISQTGNTFGVGDTSNMISSSDTANGNHNRVFMFNSMNGITSDTSIYSMGVFNSLGGNGFVGPMYGMYNQDGSSSNGARYGMNNAFVGSGFGNNYGQYNIFAGAGQGEKYGVFNIVTNTGAGDKYGVYNQINQASGGTHYGIYSDTRKAGSFAGYFLGQVSIGTTTANNYILPASRGTNGQIMQTNATGVVTWVNPVVDTDTDNQQIDVLSLTGDILNISLQDDAVATQTLNLSALDNQNTDVFSLTGNTLNLSLQNDGVATQTVDLSPFANDWKLTGNAGTVAGTNFIGTTDAQDLDFRTNNVTKLTLTQRGQLSITNTGGSVMIGSGAGDNDDFTVNQNTFVGSVSGQNTSNGNLNSGFGFNTLNDNTLGLGNTAVGANALNANVDGNNNTGLGRGANVSITNLTNATAVGFNSTVNAANKIRLGNAAITVVEGQVAYTNPSDARFKFNVQENVPGLDFIKKLKPVTYNFDTKKFDEHLNQNRNKEEVATEDFTTSTAIIRTGFLAQDVEKICADLGYNFDGLHVPEANNPTDNYGIAYSQFIMPIVKAVQEQQVIIETQKTELEQLKSELEKYKTLEQRIKALEQK